MDRLEKAEASQKENEEKQKEANTEEDEVEEEIVSSGAQKSAPAVKEETAAEVERQKRRNDILRIRAKALMRRARARSELGGWSNLSSAEEDYKTLSTMPNLSAADRKIVQTQLTILPSRTKAAQEKEMSEMWGKLKDVSNNRRIKACLVLGLVANQIRTAWKRNIEALWSQHGKFQHGKR